ncbi:hypothetical protein TNCV_1023161 [Trichonephila clavipes]|nr:hypothetical protein TNCV_1023161 [Trichonephila clavipes]
MRGDWERESDPPIEFKGVGSEMDRALDLHPLTEFFRFPNFEFALTRNKGNRFSCFLRNNFTLKFWTLRRLSVEFAGASVLKDLLINFG